MKDLWKHRWKFWILFWLGLGQFLIFGNADNFFLSFGIMGLCGGLMFLVPFTHNKDKVFGIISIGCIILSIGYIATYIINLF